MTIKKLLISNRGEIASRIIKSAHDMGISCVAIYTEADKNTPYVREADQSFKLSDSYLNAKEILEIFNKKFNGKIQTNISQLKNYCKAEEYHQKYIEKNR